MTPRKHAELIKAWADGAEIQRRYRYLTVWVDSPNPTWEEDEIYRIKPTIKLRDVCTRRRGELKVSCIAVTFDRETGEAKKVEIVK